MNTFVSEAIDICKTSQKHQSRALKNQVLKKKKQTQFEETDENAKEAFGAWEGGEVAESTEGRWVVRESPLADGAGSVREASVVYTYYCAHHRCGLIAFHHSLLSVRSHLST